MGNLELCKPARRPDGDRHAKPFIQFVSASLLGVYSSVDRHDAASRPVYSMRT